MKVIEKRESSSINRRRGRSGRIKKDVQFKNIELTESHPKKENYCIDKLIRLKSDRDSKNKSRKFLMSSISLCLSLALVLGAFEWKSYYNDSKVELTGQIHNFEDLIEIPPTNQPIPPPPKIQHPKIVEVADEEILEDIEVDLDIEITEDTKIEEIVFLDLSSKMEEEKPDEIFTIVEQNPEPVGGMKSFYEHVGENMVYPDYAKRLNIEGRIFCQFVVEKDGSLTDIKVIKGIGGGCDEEAIRVLKGAPNWNAGKQRGRPVRVRMVLPIYFKLVSS